MIFIALKKKNYHSKLKGEVNNLLLRVLRRLSPRASIIVAVYSTHSTSADYYSNSLRSNEVIVITNIRREGGLRWEGAKKIIKSMTSEDNKAM